jgi:two-component system phosphate regulon sensor histidine kinase PhoR
MSWLPGVLLAAVLLAWILRERRLRRRIRALEKRDRRSAKEVEELGQQRRLAEANLEIILSSMQEGVVVVDKRRAVRLANPAVCRLFDLQPPVINRPVLKLVNDSTVNEMVGRALEAGQEQDAELEFSIGGDKRTIAVHVAAMRDAAGEPAALAMFRDVSRLKQLENVRREFVANVSHELRTPLAIFQGYVEALNDAPDMPRKQQAEVFSILTRHSNRLNALVEDLLVLARLESGPQKMEIEPVEVRAFLDQITDDWRLQAEGKKVELVIDAPDEMPVMHADRLRLEQVFNNLMDNALKYTPEGGTITLGGSTDDGFTQLWVKDTGQGILSSHLPHIFERFYRADKARSREVGGTGLGLSIVKHIARAHGGAVEVESTFGKGTCVRLRIPTEPAPQVPAAV